MYVPAKCLLNLLCWKHLFLPSASKGLLICASIPKFRIIWEFRVIEINACKLMKFGYLMHIFSEFGLSQAGRGLDLFTSRSAHCIKAN